MKEESGLPLYSNQPHDWKKLYTVSGLVLLSLSLGMAHEHLVEADTTNNRNQNPAQVQINAALNNTQQPSQGDDNSVATKNSTDQNEQSQPVTENTQSTSENQNANQSQQAEIKTVPATDTQTNILTINKNQNSNNNANTANLYAASFAAKSSMGTDIFNIGDSNYPRVDTVDVSSWQDWMTQNDFNRLKQLGVKSVVIKLSDGDGYVNPYAQQQIQFAQNAGLIVAAYHYAEFKNQDDARREANHFADVMQRYGLGGNTVAVADMESNNIKRGNAVNDLNVFWDTLSQRGFTHHVVYTYLNLDNQYGFSNSIGKKNT